MFDKIFFGLVVGSPIMVMAGITVMYMQMWGLW